MLRSEERHQRQHASAPSYSNPHATSRKVVSTFWYIDFVAVIDVFKYRLDIVRQKVKVDNTKEGNNIFFVCPFCHAEYRESEVPRLRQSGGVFLCEQRIRKNKTCDTPLQEYDTSEQQIKARESAERLETEMRPLLELLTACASVTIPKHPLDGADEKTWGDLVPENVDERGVALGADGRAIARPDEDRPDFATQQFDVLMANPTADAAAGPSDTVQQAPVAPEWFRKSDAPAGETQVAVEPAQPVKAAETAAEDDADAMVQSYLQKAGAEHGSDDDADDDLEFEEEAAEPDGETLDPATVTVQVGDKTVPLLEVTNEHTENMTTEQFQEYFSLLKRTNLAAL